MHLKYIYIFLLSLFGPGIKDLASQTLSNPIPLFEIRGQNIKYELDDFAGIYADTSGSLSIDSIQKQTFTSFTDYTISLDANIYWLKIQIKNTLNYPTDWRLFLFEQWCEKVDVYSKGIDKEADWLIQKAGYMRPIKELDQNAHVVSKIRKVPNAVSINFQANEEKTIFIKYKRQFRDFLSIAPTLMPMTEAANQIIDYDRKAFSVIMIMGMLFILALYHLLFYFMTRDTAYLYYALYGFCAAFAATVMDKYGWFNYHVFYQNHPEIQPWVFNFVGVAAIVFYILFSRSFLHTKKRFPSLDNAIKFLMAWGILAAILIGFNFHLTGRQYLPWLPFSAFMVLVLLVFGVLLYSIWKKRRITDSFYLVGLAVLLLFIIPEHLLNLLGFVQAKDAYLQFISPYNHIQLGLITELLVFAMGLGYRTRQEKLEKQRFKELDQIKSRFFANITHEFRTPLTLVMGPLKDVMEKLKDPKDRGLLTIANQNAQRLLQLINQLLDLSKLEAGKMELQTTQENFPELLKGIVMSFESLTARKNIHLHFVSQKKEILLFIDRDKIEKIFYNLLSNAFKFTPENGEIAVMVTDHKKHIEILVRDNGIGIPGSRLPYIFDRFFQSEPSEERIQEGTGIGLALVKELITLHSGKITVESEKDGGTCFIIQLPKGKKHLKEYEIQNTDTPDPKIPRLNPTEFDLNIEPVFIEDNHDYNRDTPLILIIEDNSDVRTYIKHHLTASFQIIEAINGQEGIDKAFELLPDLIISDVMMPEKNGYEVCKILKTDQRTSHIPLILLTAKAAQEEKLQGLETGADDYLIKPFNTRELEIRVKNLIELRLQLRKRFSETEEIDKQALSTNSVDKAFLNKVYSTIDSNLSNMQFGVEVLANEVGMSKGHLNRKLNALTDQSANKLIQTYRLQKAKQLLQQKAGNVSEIAFQTGFGSTAYFVKCFGDKYGKTPGTFLQQ